jgi:hypothetical protein
MRVAFTPIYDRIARMERSRRRGCEPPPGSARQDQIADMLDSIPILIQAVLWPLLAAAILLAVGRFLPSGLRRSLAAAGAIASLLAIRSASNQATVEPVELLWTPLNFFRMGPAFHPDALSLFTGIILAGVAAAVALGISPDDTERANTSWHGLLLVALAGCLVTVMAANVPTLALGSGLLSLTLMALTIASLKGERSRAPLIAVVPGAAATLLLLLSALQMDAQAGHASLQARSFAPTALLLIGVAGILWLFYLPISGEGAGTEFLGETRSLKMASFLLPCGTGLYLLARVQTLAPVLSDRPWWLLGGGVMLLAGGMLTWLTSPWPGLALHQAGYGLLFVILLGGGQTGATGLPIPWPVVSLTLALSILAIWWDSVQEQASPTHWKGLGWLLERIESWRARARSYATSHWPLLQEWGESWLGQRQTAILPAIALASLAGLPLTVGAIGRWRLYAGILHQGNAALLLVTMLADTLLVAGLWAAMRTTLEWATNRVSAMSLVAITALVLFAVVWGISPGGLAGATGLDPVESSGVSAWGVGFLFVLPWLVGTWLFYLSIRHAGSLDRLRRFVSVHSPYRAALWAGDRLVGSLHWLSQVGEGEGWWGWALILLALTALLLVGR